MIKVFFFLFLSLFSCLSACCAVTVSTRRISSVCGWERRVTPACRCFSLSSTSLQPWSAVSSTRSSTQVSICFWNHWSMFALVFFVFCWTNVTSTLFCAKHEERIMRFRRFLCTYTCCSWLLSLNIIGQSGFSTFCIINLPFSYIFSE